SHDIAESQLGRSAAKRPSEQVNGAALEFGVVSVVVVSVVVVVMVVVSCSPCAFVPIDVDSVSEITPESLLEVPHDPGLEVPVLLLLAEPTQAGEPLTVPNR